MTKEEYQKAVKAINKASRIEILRIAKVCARDNNLVRIGDVVTDHMKSLLVDSISAPTSTINPECTYHGFLLKKDGEKRKDLKREISYQHHLKTINGTPIL